jgi:hypothetical protein
MNKTFKKTLVAASVGAVLAAGSIAANANSLLFPYFTTTSGAQSVLSLSNAGVSVAPAAQDIHYVYNYGSGCTHFDGHGSLTANDILSHSIASTSAGGFGKVVGSDASTPFYMPLANQTGFLVVSSKTTASTDALRGSMAIVDPTTGLVVSYAGIDNAADTTTTGEGDFSANTDVNFPLTFLPSSVVTTSWYGVVVGNMNADITAGRNWTAGASFTNNGAVYDNDEHSLSGTVTKTITCAGPIVASDLMNGAQLAAIGPNGGFVKTKASAVAPVAPSTGTMTGVVMMKMQYVLPSVGGAFGGKQFLHREQAGS